MSDSLVLLWHKCDLEYRTSEATTTTVQRHQTSATESTSLQHLPTRKHFGKPRVPQPIFKKWWDKCCLAYRQTRCQTILVYWQVKELHNRWSTQPFDIKCNTKQLGCNLVCALSKTQNHECICRSMPKRPKQDSTTNVLEYCRTRILKHLNPEHILFLKHRLLVHQFPQYLYPVSLLSRFSILDLYQWANDKINGSKHGTNN